MALTITAPPRGHGGSATARETPSGAGPLVRPAARKAVAWSRGRRAPSRGYYGRACTGVHGMAAPAPYPKRSGVCPHARPVAPADADAMRRVTAARPTSAWLRYPLRCSVASWPGWYGPRVLAHRGDCSGVARSPRQVCNATSTAWRSGCSGMVRPPVFPLLARFGTWIASATCPAASVPSPTSGCHLFGA